MKISMTDIVEKLNERNDLFYDVLILRMYDEYKKLESIRDNLFDDNIQINPLKIYNSYNNINIQFQKYKRTNYFSNEVNKEIEKPEKLGIIIENPGFLPEYSGYYNLHLFALIQNKIKKEEIRDAMRIVGLDPDSKKHVGKYSLGMRQRLGIAQAIMEDPDILLLDEPLNGLDNEGVEEIRKVLLSLKEKGKLIILASHSKEDIQILCDTVFRMDHGKIIATETN